MGSGCRFLPPPTTGAQHVPGEGCALSHGTSLCAPEKPAPCPAGTEEHPHKMTRGRWVLKDDGRAVQQDFRAGGSEGQRCWGVGVAPLTERQRAPGHAAFALESASQVRGP